MIPSDESYARLRERLIPARAAERPPARIPELELQARIASGEFGLFWSGIDGESVEILHFGIWNREPGPDFCGALVRINGEERRGDIEIDPDVRDWERHGHAVNPAFENVILHVFQRSGPKRFFTRTPDHRAVTQVRLDSEARKISAPAISRPLPSDDALDLIREAARFRFRRKAAFAGRLVQLAGSEEAFFQMLAAGMGYKNNKIPFQLLAQRCGLRRARRPDGEALLFGTAGFLEARDFDLGDGEVREYLAGLWRNWWTMRDREVRMILPRAAWTFAALRPANHPHRRTGVLAAVARDFSGIFRTAQSGGAEAFSKRLAALEHPYWDGHASLGRDRLPSAAALVGSERSRDLVINALAPFLGPDAGWELLDRMAGPPASRKILRAAQWLCGSVPAGFLRPAIVQQGLLQLFDDFFPTSPEKIRPVRSPGWTGGGFPANIPP